MNELYKRRILPLGNEPRIRAYPEFAFVDMIENNKMRTEDIVLVGAVSEEVTDKWYIECEAEQMFLRGTEIEVRENCYAPKRIKRAYREAKENDTIIFRIDYQQYTNCWDSAGLFLDIKSDKYEDFTTHISALTNFCCNILRGAIADETNNVESKKQYPIWIKMHIDKSSLILSYAEVEGHWKEILRHEDIIDFSKNQYVLGVYVSMAERQYYKWLFNNFINYRFDFNDASHMKYTGIMRDSRHYAINPMLRISDAYYSVLEECGVDIWDYIVANINCDRYIEFWLNEKYVPNLRAYSKRDYFHEGLVYGYDNEREVLNMVSFYVGKPKCLEVKKEDFYNAFFNSESDRANRIFLLEYNPSNKVYELDVKGIVYQLETYLLGENPTDEFKRFIGPEEGVFGLSCYEKFLTDDRALKLLISDFRITYLLQEHKQCMLERARYLSCMGYMDSGKSDDVLTQLNDIWKKANMLMILVMKNRWTKDKDNTEVIRRLLKELEDLERICYPELILSLR